MVIILLRDSFGGAPGDIADLFSYIQSPGHLGVASAEDMLVNGKLQQDFLLARDCTLSSALQRHGEHNSRAKLVAKQMTGVGCSLLMVCARPA